MSKKVVIVEDDPVTLSLLKKAISEPGIEVLTAQDGATGLALIQGMKPDLVISDMLISKIHGIELCKKIKEDVTLKDIPVILMSAVYKDYRFKYDIESSGADFFIEKPIDMKNLLSIIHNLLGLHREEQGDI
jgi:DNA-binding response OmpR family regulator